VTGPGGGPHDCRAWSVLIGVVGTEWAIRIRDRRARVDEDATELQLLRPHVVLPISELWIRERPDTSFGSDWARRRDELNRLGLRIERNARWPMRNAAKIRAAAADTVARVWAMTHDWNASQALVTASQHADLVNGQPSRVAIKRARLDDLMQSYRVQFREERAADS
jgi:hypothetical protein